MSYQVNFRLFIPDCEYWETEALRMLQKEFHDACVKVIKDAGLPTHQTGLTSAEVTFLPK